MYSMKLTELRMKAEKKKFQIGFQFRINGKCTVWHILNEITYKLFN